MWQRTIDCLGLAIEIASPLAELAEPLHAVFRTYADATGPAAIRYRLEHRDWPSVVRDDRVIGRHDVALDLVPALELDLYAQVIARAPGLLLHAGAVVGAEGGALVVAGRSGAGKSTLVRGLLARGFAYLSEECVALGAGGRCRGLARALHVDDETLAVPPGFRGDDYVIRHGAGQRRLRLFHPPAHAVWRAEARTIAVIAIEHAPEAPNTLVPVTGGAALHALWPMVFRPDPGALAAAELAFAGVARYRLHTSTPAHALAHVVALAAEYGLAPR